MPNLIINLSIRVETFIGSRLPRPVSINLSLLSILIISACSSPTFDAEQVTSIPPAISELDHPTSLPTPNVRVVYPTDTATIAGENNPTPEGTLTFTPTSPSRIIEPGMMFGVESHQLDFDNNEELFQESGLQIVRHNALLWEKIEPNEGDRLWESVADLEQKLLNASENGLNTILIIRSTPPWAQKVPGYSCGPIKSDKLDAYAEFIADAVARYSASPFNVQYWELGNEPDVDPSQVQNNSVFGCWGDRDDQYYGGRYYAEMLKAVYPEIKEANPEAQVLIGGLLLDCDPIQPPAGKNCNPGYFLEGILKNGGGEYFDILSFHGYAGYIGPTHGLGPDLHFEDHHPSWEHRGGAVLGKVDFLRQVMATYGVEKPIFLTEASLLCHELNTVDCDPPGERFFDAQADYIVRLFVRNWANDIMGTIWYQFEGPGWRYGALLDEDQKPKPVYYALQFMDSELSGTEYSGEVIQYESLEGYEFTSQQKIIWVLWSTDQVDTQIDLPENLSSVFNKYGEEITPNGRGITVNDPVFLELLP